MNVAYICSPYRAEEPEELRRNINYAKELTKTAIDAYYAPITPHLYITKVLDDNDEEQRAKGIEAAMTLLEKCNIVIVGTRYGISKGMKAEILRAEELGLSIELMI